MARPEAAMEHDADRYQQTAEKRFQPIEHEGGAYRPVCDQPAERGDGIDAERS